MALLISSSKVRVLVRPPRKAAQIRQNYFTPQFVGAMNDYDVNAVVQRAKASG